MIMYCMSPKTVFYVASVPDVLREVKILCRSLELIVGQSTSTNMTPSSTYIAPHRWCNGERVASSVVDSGFIGGVMVSVLASSVVDSGFESRSSQTKDFKIGTK